MAFFDRFPIGGDNDLFARLDALIADGDAAEIEALCRSQRAQIAAGFATWKTVPPEVRADPAATQRYANTVIAVAQLFAGALADPSLMAMLVGAPKDNPIVRWQAAIEQARAAMVERAHDEARTILEAALEQHAGLTGTGAQELRAITIGSIGQALFHAGEVHTAVERFRDALALCAAHDDTEGRVANLAALYEAHRWLGRPDDAAGFADRLAELHAVEDREAASRWAERASVARAGEPRLRVWVEIEGRHLDPDTLGPGFALEASARFVFVRDRLTLGGVTALIDRGRELGRAGDFEAALRCFAAAATLDPNDPGPEYDRGQTLLHLRRYADAGAAYRRTEALAPGWYQCRTDGWLADELAAGRLDHEALDVMLALEDDGAHSLRRAAQAVSRWPALAPLRLAHARVLARAGQRAAARAAAEYGLEESKEPDVETRLLVELAQLVEGESRTELLGRAVALGGNRIARAMAQLMLAVDALPH